MRAGFDLLRFRLVGPPNQELGLIGSGRFKRFIANSASSGRAKRI